jgi:hypothetical protein
MKKCSPQDCAVICSNCIYFKMSGERGICTSFNSPTPVDPYEWCDEFHCKRAVDKS